jgi:hypothetical protein
MRVRVSARMFFLVMGVELTCLHTVCHKKAAEIGISREETVAPS